MQELLSKFENTSKYEIDDQLENNRETFYNLMAEQDILKRLSDEIPRFPSTSLLQDKQRQSISLEKECKERASLRDTAKDRLEKEIQESIVLVGNLKIIKERIKTKKNTLSELEASLKDKSQENQMIFDQRMSEQQQYQDSIFNQQEVLEKLKAKENELSLITKKLSNDLKNKKQESAELESKKQELENKIKEQELHLMDRDSKIDDIYQENFAKTNFLNEIFNNSDPAQFSKERRNKIFNHISEAG